MEKTRQEENFSNNVVWYNYILCILVVFIHARNENIFTEPVLFLGIPVFNKIETFLAVDLAGAAVGGFYLCSGYLFFRGCSWERMPSKYKRRARNILIPYILWTLIYFFIHVMISRIPGLAAIFQEPWIETDWRTVLDAVLNYRYCAFMWFLQFLIVYAAVSPFIYILLRNRYLGAAAVLAVFFTACTNIIKNDQAAAVVNWLTLYMLGGFMGIHGRTWIECRKADIKQLFGCVLLAFAAFGINQGFPSVFGVLFYSFSFSAALWSLLAWDKEKKDGPAMPAAREWQKNTFAVYMTHFMLVQAAGAVVSRYVSRSMWIGFLLFLVLPAACFGAVNQIGRAHV